MKKFFEEFKAFALRSNVVDLAVGVLIGGAFSGLVTAFTEDIINPLLSLFGGVNAEFGWVIPIGSGILIGNFISSVINFIITAFIIFTIMKTLNKLNDFGKKAEPAAPAAPTTKICPYCKSEIAIEATRCPHCTSQLDA